MKRLLQRLWRDEQAFVFSMELILIATIAVIGLLVGLAAYRDAVVQELGDTAAAVASVNQSYSVQVNSRAANPGLGDYVTITSGGPGAQVTLEMEFSDLSSTASFYNFFYTDQLDFCEQANQLEGQAPACINFTTGSFNEEGSFTATRS